MLTLPDDAAVRFLPSVLKVQWISKMSPTLTYKAQLEHTPRWLVVLGPSSFYA